MVKRRVRKISEKQLTKGQLRKLNALRKSLGKEIAEKAFSEWYEKFGAQAASVAEDKNAAMIAAVLDPLVRSKKLRIQRGGYVVRRGRGRVIIEPAGE